MVKDASASLGKRLHAARTKRELTMQELADKANLSASGINHIEKAHVSPSAQTIEALARVLKIDPCWLAYGTGQQPDWMKKEQSEGAS